MAITDRNGLHTATWTDRASPAEVTWLDDPLASRWTKGQPEKILDDEARDSAAWTKIWLKKASR